MKNFNFSKDTYLKRYDFNLPAHLIAQEPSKVRDHSRLFVYKTRNDEIVFDYFYNLHNYLPENSLVVFNKTKVFPARIYLKKENNKEVEILFLLDEYKGKDKIACIANKKLIKGSKLFLNKKLFGEIVDQKENKFFLKFAFEEKKFWNILSRFGKTPIPKYINKTNLSENDLRKKYQSIFAKYPASIAAPTASLHFTPRVLKKLKLKGIKIAELFLNVGLGTFSSLKEKNFIEGKLHEEFFEIPPLTAKVIYRAKESKKPIVAVGTTTVRALESFALGERKKTSLFIYHPFKFQLVNILITNFHLPRSSLIILVDAFLKHKKSKRGIVELYKIAIEENFRFFSFGDAMLII